MDIGESYLEYVGEFSLSIIAISAVYFLDPLRPLTFLALLGVPALFGFTSVISRESFRSSSLSALISLVFMPLGLKFVLAGAVIALANPMVSLFAGGESFRDYYSTTTLPLLLTGLIIGISAFGFASLDPSTGDEIRNTTANFVGSYAGQTVERSGIIEDVRQGQLEMMERTSRTSVRMTSAFVFNETEGLEPEENAELAQAFQDAKQEIPERISSRAEENIGDRGVAISERVSEAVRNSLGGKFLVAIIPAATIGLYSLQPLVGILTAIFASLFAIFED